MNKLDFLLVFLAGLTFSLVLPFLRQSLENLTENIQDIEFKPSLKSDNIGFPFNINHELMDVGYIALTKIRAHDGNTALTRKETTDLEQKNDLNEAENCIRAGVRLLQLGRLSKARKLFERAVSLAPTLPQALLALGEYLEQHHSDVVRADQLYVRALMLAPGNKRAIRNRVRTKDLVAVQDSSLLQQVDVKRRQLTHVPSSAPALLRIQREAYYYHIHHTVAIEGNTMTLEEIRAVLETGLTIAGKSVWEHTEVLGVDGALRYINSTLLHRVGRVELQDLLDIHLRVLGHTDPPAAGQLRTTQVFVGPHIPPAPLRLPQLMQQFVEWLNCPDTLAMHPVRYAALAHYHLVYIHPFVDGNGRTARLLMNFLLMQAGYPPVIIRHHDRLQYYDTLQAANEGDTRPFVRFIAHCAQKTLDVYLWATRDHTPGIGQWDNMPGIDQQGPGSGYHVPSIEQSTIGQSDVESGYFVASRERVLNKESGQKRGALYGEHAKINQRDNSKLDGKFVFKPEGLPPLEDGSHHGGRSGAGERGDREDYDQSYAAHFDDLGIVFNNEENLVGEAPLWLRGGGDGAGQYKRASRYYSRLYTQGGLGEGLEDVWSEERKEDLGELLSEFENGRGV